MNIVDALQLLRRAADEVDGRGNFLAARYKTMFGDTEFYRELLYFEHAAIDILAAIEAIDNDQRRQFAEARDNVGRTMSALLDAITKVDTK